MKKTIGLLMFFLVVALVKAENPTFYESFDSLASILGNGGVFSGGDNAENSSLVEGRFGNAIDLPQHY